MLKKKIKKFFQGPNNSIISSWGPGTMLRWEDKEGSAVTYDLGGALSWGQHKQVQGGISRLAATASSHSP